MDSDAGFDERIGKFSIGVVCRNHAGKALAASAQSIRHPGSVLGAELQPIKYAINFNLKRGFRLVRIFSNSILTVQVITDRQNYLGPLSAIVWDILHHFKAPLFLNIQHVSRVANVDVHSLAHFVFSSSSPCVNLD